LPKVLPNDRAYVLFTSGSTGNPKGVVHTHESVLHNVFRHVRTFGITTEDRLTLLYPCSVYGGIRDIFNALLTGAALYHYPLRDLGYADLAEWIRTNAITIYCSVATVFLHFARSLAADEKLTSLRVVKLGGEATHFRHVDAFRQVCAASCALYSGLGSTETGMTCAYPVKQDTSVSGRTVPLGFPVDGVEILLVDPQGKVVPDGDVGEIVIRSRYLAAGYHSEPELTAKVFAADPDISDSRRYSTGDLARRDASGCLEYCGRKDRQVKIRGNRVELQEVETALLTHANVRDAAVIPTPNEDGEQTLVAYIVTDDPAPDRAGKLRAHLERMLPHYMVPSVYVELKELPLTPNGKIDKRALPRPPPLTSTGGRAAQAEAAKGDEIEHRLIEMWSAELRAPVDRSSGLISEYGATSLTCIRMAAAIQKQLGARLRPDQLLTADTIANQVRLISELSSSSLAASGAPRPETRATAPRSDRRGGVAIVGMACRFPGAKGLEEFWRLLREGTDAITTVPQGRWRLTDYFDPTVSPGKMNSQWGGFLDSIDQFDRELFAMAPTLSEHTDPQQRLLLETAWEALEDAFLPASALAGSNTGVFVGISQHDYERVAYRQLERINAYTAAGVSTAVAANRLSYFFDLRGPSLAIDTACSSSLVALHYACQALHNGESDLALAAGANLIVSPDKTVALSQPGFLSGHGRCKAFSAEAEGFVRGEGVGVVVLKPLDAALADGDRIYAVLRGTAVNQDGLTSGLTVPSGAAQERVIADAMARAGVRPSELDYIEAHGTGTRLGDPIEVAALSAALAADAPARKSKCRIGSVKTNIGHLEAAAGIAGVIKTALCLHHRTLVPSLHASPPNPDIAFEQLPVAVQTETEPWPTGATPTAGVSSFGFGGTNAHAILQASPSPAAGASGDPMERPVHVLVLSGASREALTEQASRYAALLESSPSMKVADVCHTAATGRSHLEHRLAMRTGDRREALAQLREFLAGGSPQETLVGKRAKGWAPKIAFLFTGQGAQYTAMGKELFLTQPVFRRAIERCDGILKNELDRPLLSLLFDAANAPQLDQTAYTQPATFALGYALAALWRSWGIEPYAVVGHSVGEVAAACIAGVLSLEDALRLVAARGRAMQALPGDGSMVSIRAGVEQVVSLIRRDDSASIAAINGPENVVLSGSVDRVAEIVRSLEARGVQCKRLTVSHAFHSPLMDPALDDIERIASSVRFQAPRLKVISTLTGAPESERLATSSYWRRQARDPVQFADALRGLVADGCNVLVEMGAQPVLLGMARLTVSPEVVCLPSLRRGTPEWRSLTSSLATYFVKGGQVDWRAFDGPYRRQRVAVPRYAFQRQRYWLRESQAPAIDGRSVESAPRAAEAPRAKPQPLKGDQMVELVRRVLSKILGRSAGDIPHDLTLTDAGLDSLMLVELCNDLNAAVGEPRLSIAFALGNANIAAIAERMTRG
jgi:phthiocerol/phenolphthiocerol synthesis type-I polyketide synthase C